MHLTRLVARGFRNLADIDVAVPAAGFALVGPNGHGKTNVLEALSYPVLFRSVRGAPDREVAGHQSLGFTVGTHVESAMGSHEIGVAFKRARSDKTITLDGSEIERRVDAVGTWLCVAFLPEDTMLVSGGAAERRAYLDRMLALADRQYFSALSRYRAAMTQRNAALRQRQPAMARAFEAPMAQHGSRIVRMRRAWAESAAVPLAAELAVLGESAVTGVRYNAPDGLDDDAGWQVALDAARIRDEWRGTTSVGPHRHDLDLTLNGQPVRSFGSTGQQRTMAIALRLTELETLRAARGETPALVLDDVFAELDGDRTTRLGARLVRDGASQVFLSAPRLDELPEDLALNIWHVTAGAIEAA